jgi:hypothetical protein
MFVSSVLKRFCLVVLLVLLPLTAFSEAQTIKMIPVIKQADSPSAADGEDGFPRVSSSAVMSSVYDGRWKGNILTVTKTDRNTEAMSLNIKSDGSGFIGTGVIGQNHIFEVHGYVDAGNLILDIPGNELDPQCSGWDLTLRGTLDKSLTVMTLAAKGTVCGEGGGQDGDVSAVLTKKFSTDNSLKSIVYNGKQYVAVGDEGTLITSDDAVSWTKQDSVATIWDVSFGKGHFVAVGDAGRILTSEDGLKWQRRSSGTTGVLYCIAYGNERFIAAGSLGQIVNSSDGITWDKPIRPTGTTFRKLIFAKDQFIAIGDDNKIYFSANGIAWKKKDLGTDAYNADSFLGIAFGNGQLITVGTSARTVESTILTSADFNSWKRRTYDLVESLIDIAYGNNMFVAVGYDGAIFSSRDGSEWVLRRLGTNDLRGVVFGDGRFVVVGDNKTILISTDGVSWPLPSSGTRNTLNMVTYGAGKYVAVGEYGTVLTSVDGDSWVYRTTDVTAELKKVAFGNDRFVATGREIILVSDTAEGIRWNNYFNKNTGSLSDIAFGNGVFVGIGGFGRLLTSVDGKVWQKQKLEGRVRLRNIIFADGKFLLIGRDNIFESTNGYSWQHVSANNRSLSTSITAGKGLLVGVGDYGTIETSTVESVNRWSVQYSGTTNTLKNCVYGNGIFVAVGVQGTILTSEDGEEWLAQMSVTGNTLNSLVFGNDQFVVVGRSGTILTSQDGESWSEQTPVTELEIKEIEQPLL